MAHAWMLHIALVLLATLGTADGADGGYDDCTWSSSSVPETELREGVASYSCTATDGETVPYGTAVECTPVCSNSKWSEPLGIVNVRCEWGGLVPDTHGLAWGGDCALKAYNHDPYIICDWEGFAFDFEVDFEVDTPKACCDIVADRFPNGHPRGDWGESEYVSCGCVGNSACEYLDDFGTARGDCAALTCPDGTTVCYDAAVAPYSKYHIEENWWEFTAAPAPGDTSGPCADHQGTDVTIIIIIILPLILCAGVLGYAYKKKVCIFKSQTAVEQLPANQPIDPEKLRQELQKYTKKELRTKAAEAGCDQGAIEEARETSDGKAALIELIVADATASLVPDVVPVVVSCPERGSLDGSAPRNDQIMDMMEHLSTLDPPRVVIAYDRAGTSNASPADKDAFEAAVAVRGTNPDNPVWKKQIMATNWWMTYIGGTKKSLITAAQQANGEELTVVCIHGGPITQVEMEQMPTILNDAKSDAKKSGLTLQYNLQNLQYGDFLEKYAPESRNSTAPARKSRPAVAKQAKDKQKAELQHFDTSQLKTKAAAAGCDRGAIDEALDAEDTKTALIELIVAKALPVVVPVVVSCPERGSLDGSAPRNDQIMDMMEHLSTLDPPRVVIAYDRAGTSNASPADKDAFEAAVAIREVNPDNPVWKEQIMATNWWMTYIGGTKKSLITAAQQANGEELTVVCIHGGPITQVEMEQMPTILNDAKSDAKKSGLTLQYNLQNLQYGDFLEKYTTDDMRMQVTELP